MMQIDPDMEFIPQVSGQRIGRIYAPVLSARTTKADLEAFETPADIILHGDIDDIVCTVEEVGHSGVLFQKVLYRLVAAGQMPEFFHPAGGQDTAAVEDGCAPVARYIRAYCLFVGEAVDMDDQRRMLVRLYRFKTADDPVLHHQTQQPLEFRHDDAHLFIPQEPFEIPERQRYTDEEMSLPLEKPSESVGSQHLQKTDQDIPVVLTDEPDPVDLFIQYFFHDVHIVFEQAVFPPVGQFRFGLP